MYSNTNTEHVVLLIFWMVVVLFITFHIQSKNRSIYIPNQTVAYAAIRPNPSSFGITRHQHLIQDKIILSLEEHDDIHKLYQQEKDFDNCSTVSDTIQNARIDSFPLVALASFPRSGNTWTRHILQIASQYYTSTVYWKAERHKPNAPYFRGGEYDYNEKRGICTKTHSGDKEVIDCFSAGAILIIRNPRKVAVSNVMHQKITNEDSRDDELRTRVQHIRNNTDKWRSRSLGIIKRWKNLYTSWIEHAKRVLVVHYDNLCENTYDELKRILNFLNLPINGYYIQCAVDLKPCHLHEYFDFQPDYPDEYDELIDKLNQTLKDKKLPPLPTYSDHRSRFIDDQNKHEPRST
ncbi:sialate:O-sulfotransferase 1-like [Apostichopus japonicus]|uniref:sialate:O-sulfotransferase 1-like n=1 Tax=Stichopus japonicus TaxID=307972 RepID=UPI003AB70CD9